MMKSWFILVTLIVTVLVVGCDYDSKEELKKIRQELQTVNKQLEWQLKILSEINTNTAKTQAASTQCIHCRFMERVSVWPAVVTT